jgi:hypothetical protein
MSLITHRLRIDAVGTVTAPLTSTSQGIGPLRPTHLAAAANSSLPVAAQEVQVRSGGAYEPR